MMRLVDNKSINIGIGLVSSFDVSLYGGIPRTVKEKRPAHVRLDRRSKISSESSATKHSNNTSMILVNSRLLNSICSSQASRRRRGEEKRLFCGQK